MSQNTPLYSQHTALNAHIVDFCGWQMPLHYGSQLEEHQAVRSTAGMFDVSHMAIIDLTGVDSLNYLRYLLANDAKKLKPGRALYTCLLNHKGGVVDDMIVYYLQENHYRIVANAGSRESVWQWLNQQKESYQVTLTLFENWSIIAVQGPDSLAKMALAWPSLTAETLQAMRPFSFIQQGEALIARTGYTGERNGLEVMLPAASALELWQNLLAQGVHPCGLGARDSLRLEAGFNLYGSDMDESVTPLESNLAWTVSWTDENREFIGKAALQQQLKAGIARQLVGLILSTRGMMRAHQKVMTSQGEGEITSGGFSPHLGHSIALARIPNTDDKSVTIDSRGKTLTATIINPPFIGGKHDTHSK